MRFHVVAVALALSTTGCTQIFGLDAPIASGDGGLHDGPTDSVDVRVVDVLACYGTGLYSVCFNAPPTGNVSLSGTIMTDSDPRCESTITDACVIAGGDISVATVKALGPRPLVLVADVKLTIGALLDAGSRFVYSGAIPTGEEKGAGTGTTAGCIATGTGANQVSTTGAGGGAGGSFGGRGGSGGRGGGLAIQATAASVSAFPTTLQGGCPGGDGGSAGANSKGLGGRGGGAVYLIGSVIEIVGTINVGGAGGTGGILAQGGAGGGGSGGFIGIDAPTISCASDKALVLANGGGGGEGGGVSTSTGTPGTSAADVTTTNAPGGMGANQYGGDGGDGAINSQTGSPGQTGNSLSGDGGGGGGGGGGTGFIKVYGGGSLSGCTVSPPAL